MSEKQRIDPIVAEIRVMRTEHAARFGYDIRAIFADLRARQLASGRTYVRYSARRIPTASPGPQDTSSDGSGPNFK